MRRKDRERDLAFAYEVLDSCDWMALSMTDGAGRPYCVPVQGVREGDCLYFHCAREGQKTDCLRARPEVCVTAVSRCEVVPGAFTTAYRSAVATGRAREVTGEEERLRALELLARRYAPEDMDRFAAETARYLPATAVWRISLEQVTGKENRDGD